MVNKILTLDEIDSEVDFSSLEKNSLGDSEPYSIDKLKIKPPSAFRTREYVYLIAIKFIKGIKTIKIEDPETGKTSSWFELP